MGFSNFPCFWERATAKAPLTEAERHTRSQARVAGILKVTSALRNVYTFLSADTTSFCRLAVSPRRCFRAAKRILTPTLAVQAFP